MLTHTSINAKKLALWLLLTQVLAGNTIEQLEQNSNELLDSKESNSTNGNKATNSTAAGDAMPRQYYPQFGGAPAGGGLNGFEGCPLCDASVYSYCSQKMLHDDCCCDYPVPQLRPPQCFYTDCSLLYAKSCYEHSLIKNCCCYNPY